MYSGFRTEFVSTTDFRQFGFQRKNLEFSDLELNSFNLPLAGPHSCQPKKPAEPHVGNTFCGWYVTHKCNCPFTPPLEKKKIKKPGLG